MLALADQDQDRVCDEGRMQLFILAGGEENTVQHPRPISRMHG